jgi:3',5'-cyclic AMP phosphodiesterase CpdA
MTEILQPLRALIERLDPELVIASGDLTHRGRRDQHERVAGFLKGLGPPVLAIPGNHDMPYTFPARFTKTFAEFERHWETTEPVFRSDTLLAVGLNTARPWRHQSGGVRDGRLEWASRTLDEAAPGALRVVALHHHMLGAPWRSRKKPVAKRNHVLASLVEAGAELIVAGHIHQSTVAERREFEVVSGGERGVCVSIAPGLGQPRPNRRGEARGLHVYEAGEGVLTVSPYSWRDTDWGLTSVRRFARGREPLSVETPR